MIGNRAFIVDQANAGDDRVLASGKQAQHRARVNCIGWLFQDAIIDHHDRVRAQHDLARPRRGGSGFFEGQPARILNGGFLRLSNFLDRPRTDRKLETRDRQQFAAAWGFGRKDKFWHVDRYSISRAKIETPPLDYGTRRSPAYKIEI